MDQEYPDRNDQDLDPERTAGRAPADPDTPALAGGLPPTGDNRVDEAVAGLSRLPGRPADEHVAVLEEVHGRLRDILGELNEGAS